MMNRIAIDMARAITPSLLGIDRRIAYANRNRNRSIRMVGVLAESRNLNLRNISHRLLQLSACMVN
jgi:hypothetical protein